MSTPNFYNINFEREVVVQGKNTTFLSITRNEDEFNPNDNLVVVLYPQVNTWEHYVTVNIQLDEPGTILKDTWKFKYAVGSPALPNVNDPSLKQIVYGLEILNWEVIAASLVNNINPNEGIPLEITPYETGIDLNYGFSIKSKNGVTFTPPTSIITGVELGKYNTEENNSWQINGGDTSKQVAALENQAATTYWQPFDTTYKNPFDGTIFGTYGQDTGFFSRKKAAWISLPYDSNNTENNGISIRVDYDGELDSHLKLNLIIAKINKFRLLPRDLITNDSGSQFTTGTYGWKNGADIPRDYQEVHFFGYREDYVKTKRDNEPISFDIENPIYDDQSSYALLKTNPKISGNVKLTTDSNGDIWLNSFDANDELANSAYKKYQISPTSTYQRDVHYFFNKGKTPANVVFEPYQFDTQYLNTKRTFDQQYDNFYNYGVEQLRSKFYDEDFTFLAPLWLRKDVPEFFLIFRIDGPLNIDSYLNTSNATKFTDFFNGARLIKTFDMRASAKLGTYLRNIVNDERYKERPLEVSWESDVATYWSGISYKEGTITSKGEFLYDYYRQDRPVKEYEDYITSGFERNGIISTNLINLEFLFNDEEADLYSINRYFGIYVKENQLAEFQIEPSVLGKIQVASLASADPTVLPVYQSPAPKLGVDGEPYSLREFTQTNPDGIQIPIHYFHNETGSTNTTNIPTYQGDVLGKLPLPAMVDDPLRFFYVKDRNDVFKRVNQLTEVDYGIKGTADYIRATQLQLFDSQENMSSYSGVTNITSQYEAELLDSGNSQLVLQLIDQTGTGVFAEDEELVINVDNYNSFEDDVKTYYIQVTDAVLGSYVKVKYFIGDFLTSTTISTFNQPPVNGTVSIAVQSSTNMFSGEFIYIIGGGYYQITDVNDVLTINTPAQTVSSGQSIATLTTPVTNTVIGTNGTYTGITQLSNTGVGVGATFNVVVSGGAVTSVTLNAQGANYNLTDVITINTSSFGISGTLTISPATLVPVTYSVTNATSSGNGTGFIFNVTYNAAGAKTVVVTDGGRDNNAGDIITIPASSLGGGIATNMTFTITAVIHTIVIKNLGMTGNTAPVLSVFGNALIGKHFDSEQTYYVNPISSQLQLDTYLTIDMYNTGGYVPGNAWQVEVNNGSVIKTLLSGTNPIDATIPQEYSQFRWRLKANGTGLQPGDAWDYPVYDPNGADFITHFSPEGTPAQVAKAISKAISTFGNIPVKSYSNGETVYLKSKLAYEEGNTITLTRNLTPQSYYTNLGFYEKGNCERKESLTQLSYTGLSDTDLSPRFIEFVDQPTDTAYYVKITKTTNGAIVTGALNCTPTSYATLTSTGTPFWFNYVGDVYEMNGLPISLDMSNLTVNETVEVAYSLKSTSVILQNFIGGVKRKRNRAKVSYENGTKYFTDRRTIRLGNTVLGSKIISLESEALYVGASISGNGIPTNSFIVDVNATSITINNAATITATGVTLNIGEITSLNNTKIRDQWFQCQKGLYSEIKGWNVQGKLLYSLPYLEEPLYDGNDNITEYKSLGISSIIQIENPTQEIYTTPDKRIVAWSIYRPVLGIFSLYPIKEFDFDFILSDYAYTPTIETFPYFLKETLQNNEELELSVNENYKLSQNSPTSFELKVSVKTPNTDNWYIFDTLTFDVGFIGSPELQVLLNTYYPFYRYDETEYPYLSVNGNYNFYVKPYAYRGTGLRNYQRLYLRTGNDEIIYPEKIKITYVGSGSAKLTITNYNYEQDLDITQFNGFAGLQDITSIDDENKIQELKDDGEYIQAFTYQLLFSEYDRLRENYNKDWAVRSIVVPYINKWVQEGTDARDNYYRLNNSMAFGINNMSPSNQIDFVETSVLTNEFPYLDSVPKDYFEDALEGSRSYMFTKLDEVAVKGKTWYELLKNDDTNDWFTKYFSVGYPSEEVYSGNKITKPREERFTFFKYVNGLGKSQTLFRGVKIQGVVFDDSGVAPIEMNESTVLDDYKFASVARFVKPGIDFELETPIKIEVIKNDKFKSIVMIFTIYINDYRTQSGHMNYFLLYAMNDILKNENQNQLPTIAQAILPVSLNIKNFLPYDGSFSGTDIQNQVLRPRQGMLGGGYLELGNKRLGGNFNLSSCNNLDPVTGKMDMGLKQINNTYLFNLLNELNTTRNNYIYLPYNFVTPPSVITAKNLTVDGFFSSFAVSSKDSLGNRSIRTFFDSQDGNYISINPLNITFKTGDIGGRTYATTTYSAGTCGLEYSPIQSFNYQTIDAGREKETYVISGGTDGHNSMQNYLTIGNVQALVNTQDPAIEYYNVGSNNIVNNYRIRFVSPDSIIKEGLLQFAEDTDKPQEYLNSALIGYDIVDTNTQEYMLRHRGFYEPKSRDIISFWVREDNEFSKHYEKDFLLGNTHINTSFSLSGLLRNYGINKVATSGEVLKIARESAYKSLYPLINEVAITSTTGFALNSSWDSEFYRNYSTTADWVPVEGIAEMKELKSFLASKAMNVPKSHEFQTFSSTEVVYTLEDPIESIGVSYLETITEQYLPNANKPKLIIDINVKARLLRQLINDIDSGNYINEFDKLPLYSPNVSVLAGLTTAQINELKTNYFNKNIINLYNVSEVNLWVLNKEGIQLLSLELSEADKTSAGYKIDKDCVVTQVTDFDFRITKTLDAKIPSGFAISVLLKRIWSWIYN